MLNQTYHNSYELTTENMFFVKILVLKNIFYIIKQIYARTWTGAILMEAKWKFLLVGSLEKIEIWNIDNPYLRNHLETKKLRLFLIKSVLSLVRRVFDIAVKYKLQWKEFSICKFRLY